MIDIVLCCAAGLSTSMLMDEMKIAAQKRKLSIKIDAIPQSNLYKRSQLPDVILLGPQVSYSFQDIKAEYEHQGVRVAVIDMMVYGMLDGDAVLQMVLQMMEDK